MGRVLTAILLSVLGGAALLLLFIVHPSAGTGITACVIGPIWTVCAILWVMPKHKY